MTTKYQRALWDMKQGATWQEIADELSDALGDKVHRSDAWNVAHGRSRSWKIETALELAGKVKPPRKRYRLACDFASEKARDEFRKFYNLHEDFTFSDWVHLQWMIDTERRGELNGTRRISF